MLHEDAEVAVGGQRKAVLAVLVADGLLVVVQDTQKGGLDGVAEFIGDHTFEYGVLRDPDDRGQNEQNGNEYSMFQIFQHEILLRGLLLFIVFRQKKTAVWKQQSFFLSRWETDYKMPFSLASTKHW